MNTVPSFLHELLRLVRQGRAHGLYMHCSLEGSLCRALVDTGSPISLGLSGTLPGTEEPRPQQPSSV